MKIIRLILPFFIFLFYTNYSNAQYFNDGQDKASLHWRHIYTTHFEVIFPEGFEQKGEHVAKLLEKAYDYVPNTLNHSPRKISVVLHTGTVKSNAFLGWCPARIEMYTTPNQGIYSQDWLEQLSLHEFRHMVQVSKLETEMPQLLRVLFGEHAAALLTGMYLPFWFIEGDAVATETGLSESGRGRTPSFFHEYKALLVEKGSYSYDKAYMGSYRDFIPNHYEMGYLMVAGAREKYNKLLWDSVTHSIARHPFSLIAFNRSVKKYTGLSTTGLYKSVFGNLTNRWLKEDSLLVKTAGLALSPRKRHYTGYSNGVCLMDGSLFALRTSVNDIDRFVSIDKRGKENVLFTPGYYFEESVTACGNKIIWSERLNDIRWNHADKSLLRIFDTDTKKLKEFRYDSKIFAPSLSPDRNRAIAVEADNLYRFYLSEIDLQSGKIIRRYMSDGNDYFITPLYYGNSGKILTVVLHDDKKGIELIDLNDSTAKVILPFRRQEVKRPSEYKGYIWYIGGFRGTDDLYALDTLTSKNYRVITSRFGINDYSFDRNSVICSDYTANGFRLVNYNLDSIPFQEIQTDTVQNKLPFASTLARQEKHPVNFKELDDVKYASEPYRKAGHLLKFHSWAPLSVDPYNYTFYPGVSFMSQNMLSTAETIAGYRYKWEEEKGEIYADFKYMGWFPVIDLHIDNGNQKSYYYLINQYVNHNNEVVRIDTVKKNFTWNETNMSALVYLPFNLSKGKYYRSICPSINYHLTSYHKNANAPSTFPEGIMNAIEYSLSFYSLLHQSVQDIYPEWGISGNMGYMHSLKGIYNLGNLAYIEGSVYLPGLFENHGIKLYGGYQTKNQGDFSLTDRVRFPRGHLAIDNREMFSYNIDYKFPLAYPDLSISRLVFIKRICLGLFYDQAFIHYPYTNGYQLVNMQSGGIEVMFNTNFCRFFAPVDIGFRNSYLFDRSFKTDFLFNMSFTL